MLPVAGERRTGNKIMFLPPYQAVQKEVAQDLGVDIGESIMNLIRNKTLFQISKLMIWSLKRLGHNGRESLRAAATSDGKLSQVTKLPVTTGVNY